jgi:intracellular sulfur oxidation DsrE/DsrF family protein
LTGSPQTGLFSLALLAGFVCTGAWAQEFLPEGSEQRYIARIELHSAAELAGILRRADVLFSERGFEPGEPVVFVLHGAEGRVFLRQSYPQNKSLVDLAARLSALGVVDIKVCETWMGGQNIERAQLLPFVGTVANGPEETLELMNEKHYSYF